jgi:hypothetical protein
MVADTHSLGIDSALIYGFRTRRLVLPPYPDPEYVG